MKLIKKMLAIMFAFMMVVGMGTKVNAEEGAQPNTEGSITITNALPKQEYKLYRILELESFNTTSGAYSYKLSEKWKGFISDANYNAGKYLKEENGYVTWINENSDDATVRVFAEEALKYAQVNGIECDSLIKNETGYEKSIAANNLPLGYYLVDSSAGALCNVNTTRPNVEINEKNGTPTVEKKVKEDSKDTFESSNTADIGQTLEFKTTITAQAGAQNYVLHDKMDAGLTFTGTVSVSLKKNDTKPEQILENNKDYVLKTSDLGEICTFHIEFTKDLCDSLSEGDQIIVSYSAILNENAVVGNAGNKNDTWLKYGNGTDTAHSSTTTKTYEIPVFKYTGNNKPLAGAKFTLSKNSNGSDPIELIKVNDETKDLTYRVAKTGEKPAATEITTPSKGEFVIQGLDADTYYLTEIEAPKGYNKLAAPIEVVIDGEGNVKLNKTEIVATVKVENKTGTLLPSTGGMGTTIIYMAGAILVIASGIVLVSKKKSKAK